MSKYLELIEGSFTQEHLDKQKNQNPYVAYSINDDKVIYSIAPEPVVYDPWVTFMAEEANSTIGLAVLSTNQTLEYSTDTTTWSNMNTSTTVTLANIGDEVYVRGILSGDNTSSNWTQFNMTGKIAASGNCNALWNYEDLNAPLKAYCGAYLFSSCKSLTAAPELPATTLTDACYQWMFYSCTSLTTAPELPATTSAYRCYGGMFQDCTSLTTAPKILPVTTLVEYCCWEMFSGCTSLTVAPELPATTLAKHCYRSMFENCISLTVAPELPATTLAVWCYESMFNKCTSLIVAPELPATTLTDTCYCNMFRGCTKLNYIKCLATDISATDCTFYWVNGLSSTGTFIKHPNATWSTGRDGIPSGWTVENAVL